MGKANLNFKVVRQQNRLKKRLHRQGGRKGETELKPNRAGQHFSHTFRQAHKRLTANYAD